MCALGMTEWVKRSEVPDEHYAAGIFGVANGQALDAAVRMISNMTNLNMIFESARSRARSFMKTCTGLVQAVDVCSRSQRANSGCDV